MNDGSHLLAEAIHGGKLESVQEIIFSTPKLLWQLLPFNENDYPRTMIYLRSRGALTEISVTQLYPVHILMIMIYERSLSPETSDMAILINLIKIASADDLNTCFFGYTDKSSLHLANLLGQRNITQQLLDQGALEDTPDSHESSPKDTTQVSEGTLDISRDDNRLKKATKDRHQVEHFNKPNMISSKFKQLQQLAEEGTNSPSPSSSSSSLLSVTNPLGKRQNSTRRYFQPGHLEERRRKVLQDEDEAKKAGTKNAMKRHTANMRQLEVESLAKQSRVRNNPLLKKFEQQRQQQEQSPSPAFVRMQLSMPKSAAAESVDRSASKDVHSLQGRFVTTSVFRQQSDDTKENEFVTEDGPVECNRSNTNIERIIHDHNDDSSQHVAAKECIPTVANYEQPDSLMDHSANEDRHNLSDSEKDAAGHIDSNKDDHSNANDISNVTYSMEVSDVVNDSNKDQIDQMDSDIAHSNLEMDQGNNQDGDVDNEMRSATDDNGFDFGIYNGDNQGKQITNDIPHVIDKGSKDGTEPPINDNFDIIDNDIISNKHVAATDETKPHQDENLLSSEFDTDMIYSDHLLPPTVEKKYSTDLSGIFLEDGGQDMKVDGDAIQSIPREETVHCDPTQFPAENTNAISHSQLRDSHSSVISDAVSEQWFDSQEDYAGKEFRQSNILATAAGTINGRNTGSNMTSSVGARPLSVLSNNLVPIESSNQASNEEGDDYCIDEQACHENITEIECTVDIQSTTIPPLPPIPLMPTEPQPTTRKRNSIVYRLSHETEESQVAFKFHSQTHSDDESDNTWPPPSPKPFTSDAFEETLPATDSNAELHQDKSQQKAEHVDDHVTLTSHSNFVVNQISGFQSWHQDVTTAPGPGPGPGPGPERLSSLQNYEYHEQQQQRHQQQYYQQYEAEQHDIDDSPQPTDMPHPILPLTPEAATSGYGKLYIRMTYAHDMLLPLSTETTYVRCLINDGCQEFLSRYEVLSNEVQFQYECTMDTYPGMIISMAMQVRPDAHVRPLTGLSRLFSSAYRQKKSLAGYVHPDEHIIGQARFALEDMVPACNQKTYDASFDCFNSWFVRSAKERKRLLGGQTLKVIGQLAVKLLYIPVSDPSMSIPSTLQECDLALRIRQWHSSTWRTGYLSTRQKGDVVWKRRYFQLIGSQLLGYYSEKELGNYVCHYDITNAIQLTVAAEQVLVDTVNANKGDLVFSQNTICDENRRGFFRITFAGEDHIDCVCDKVHDSELWVKVFRAMIGRVPLTVSAAVFLN